MKNTEKHQKKTFIEAHTATKRACVMVLFIFISLFLIGTVSAANWDNKLSYSENDLKVTLRNSIFRIIPTTEIGTIELKSHSFINEVKKVGAGNQVVMWYDFNFIELYLNGLGKVEFTDMETGQEIKRDYSFVYWGEKERYVYEEGDCFLNINGTQTCENIVGKETYNDWLPYNSKDIPKGKIRIGLLTYVKASDKVDGVWTIIGRKVSRHAEWEASLNVGLVSWYEFEEDAGDYVPYYPKNTTLGNNPTFISGKVNNAITLNGVDQDASNTTGHTSLAWGSDFSFSVWFNVTGYSEEGGSGAQILANFLGLNDRLNIGINSSGYAGVVHYTGAVEAETTSNPVSLNTWYHMIGITYANGTQILYLDNVKQDGYDTLAGIANPAVNVFAIGQRGGGLIWFEGQLDEFGIWNRTLTEGEIVILYNNGMGCTLGLCAVSGPIMTLLLPENNADLTINKVDFSANISDPYLLGIQNVTLEVVYPNGTLFYSETNTSGYEGIYNWTNITIPDGNWNWSVGAYDDANDNYETNTRIFTILAFILEKTAYNNQTWETALETFFAEFYIRAGTEIALAQLIYNGTPHTITNISQSGTSLNLTKTLAVSLNTNPFANQTKSFKYKFTYEGEATFESEELEQNVSFINFQKCSATYNVQALNFTFLNEINQTNINATATPTTFESNWKYWIGNGDIYKTYPYQNLSSSLNNYQFCISPYIPNNHIFRVDGDIEFSATTFRENEYHLRNATLTNVSNDNYLYLIHTNYATKFFLTFKKGTSLIKGATITIQKYFTGLGEFKTVGIQFSDDDGEATMWGEVDKTYKFFIVKDGELLGAVERNTICAVAPCTLSIIIKDVAADIFASYYELFGQNIVSTLGYNKTSKIITYSFVDTTGLANYFRLKVQRVMLNETKDVVCNSQSFSTAGTLTCNLTGKSGEFKATTYVSRSPELIDKILNVITDDEVLESLGLMGIFLIMALIITIVFAAAIIGRGSPSVVLWALAASILLLKLAHLFPFTWAVVITLEVIIFFLISQVKT